MLDSQVARPNNLPIQLTSFIDREREIAQVKGFLSRTKKSHFVFFCAIEGHREAGMPGALEVR